MANERGRQTVIRRLVKARPLLAFLLLGSLALVAAIALIDSRSQVTFPPNPVSDSAGEVTEPQDDSPVDDLKARDVSGFDIFSPPSGGAAYEPLEIASVEDVLEKELRLAEQSPGPLVADLPPLESVISEQRPRVGAILSSGAAG